MSPSEVMSTRVRYWLLVVVGVIYVLLSLLLHRRLHRVNVESIFSDNSDAADVDERLSLAFPVLRRCIGPFVTPPSLLLPLGTDWLYTAYFDDRLKPRGPTYIRVLALLRRRIDLNRKPTFYFRWQQLETGNTTIAAAEAYEMCENHGRRYGGWILSTRFVGQLPPCSIIVTRDSTGTPQVRLPVFRMRADERSRVVEEDELRYTKAKRLREKFAVCVPPLYGAITPITLVQFVELTRLLGVQHFVFYVSDVSESVRQVLDGYEADGIATTIRWTLPAVAAKSVWYHGQLLTANDCLYRTSHAFHHVAFNDVDEFIVPHSASNWSAMLAQLASVNVVEKRRPSTAPSSQWANQIVDVLLRSPSAAAAASVSSQQSNVCGYVFHSAFFQSLPLSFRARHTPTSAYSNAPAAVDQQPSYDVTSVQRSAFSHVRTKVIVQPSAVFELGIHHVSRPLYSLPAAAHTPTDGGGSTAPTKVVVVDPDVAFVHHYRDCTNDYEYKLDCNVAMFVTDARIVNAGYIPTLRKHVQIRLEAARRLHGSSESTGVEYT